MDSQPSSRDFWITGVIFFLMVISICAAIVWIVAAVYSQTPSPSTVSVRLDEVELAVQNRERAGAEMLGDRLLGIAAADANNAVVTMT
jgi:hypothetical protein